MLSIKSIRSQVIIGITLLFLSILTLLPMVWVVLSSFKSDAEIFGSSLFLPKTWNLDNYLIAWTKGKFDVYFMNSIVIATATTLITVITACTAGYAFAKLKLRNHPIIFYFVLFGMTMPAQSVIIPIFYQLKSYGLLDSRMGLILAQVGLELPFAIYLIRNFFREIPNEIIEAAVIDGSNTWEVFRKIMLPLSLPGVTAVAVFSFIGSWNDFLLSLLVLISDENRTIPLGLIQFQQLNYANYGVVFAGVTLALIPSVIIYILLQRSFVSGISSGSLK